LIPETRTQGSEPEYHLSEESWIMPDPVGLVILQLVVELFKQPEAQGVIATVHNVVSGKTLLLMGPQRAGKTTFAEYLRRGELMPEDKYKLRTLEEQASASFAIGKSQDESVLLRVRKAIDVPGHHKPEEQLRIFEEKRPDAILLMIDLSKPMTSEDGSWWLEDFCDQLAFRLRDKDIAEHLKCLLVVLNKADHADVHEIESRTREIREILQQRLRVAWNPTKVDAVRVLPCISVRSPRGSEMIDDVIRALAYALEGN
jgi:signal recognition particle receptor subunit beta